METSEKKPELSPQESAPPGTPVSPNVNELPTAANSEVPAGETSSPPPKPDGRKRAKKLLIGLGIALVVLLILNAIPFDLLTEKAVEKMPEVTDPVVTYSEEFFVVPDYEEDISADANYQKLNRLMTFSRDGESFRVTEETADSHGVVCRLFQDYFTSLMAGDTAACTALFTDEYLQKNGAFTFAPQKIYDMTVEVVRSEVLTEGDAKGEYKGYTVTYCEVAYKIRQNNGTLRRDFYEDGVTLPVLFEVLEKDGGAQINQIRSIRTGNNSNNQDTTQGGSVIMYVIWIIVMAAAIIIEAASAAITAIWFMPAALVSLILALCNVSWQIQVLVFVLLSAIFLLIGTLFIKKRLKTKYVPTNADRLIGTTGIVSEEIDNQKPSGEVKADGKRWSARSEDGSIIEEGATVTILRIEGVKLIVEKKK